MITPAIDVHHIDSFTKYEGIMKLQKAYDFSNLMSLCKQCHQLIHNKNNKKKLE
jgi:5-methylcytosine-specific restriction protein A